MGKRGRRLPNQPPRPCKLPPNCSSAPSAFISNLRLTSCSDASSVSRLSVYVCVCVCVCVFTARSFLCLFESTATHRSSPFIYLFIYFIFAEERERGINSLFTHKLVGSVWTGSEAAGQTRSNAVDSFNVCAKCL